MKVRHRFKVISIAFVFTLCVSLSCTFWFPSEKLIFADTGVVWWLAPTIVAGDSSFQESGETNFYEDNSLEVETFFVQTGLASKNAVLSGSADIGLVASTPLAVSAQDDEDILVIASFVEADNLLAIVTEVPDRDAEPTSTDPNSDGTLATTGEVLIPKAPIAIVPGTISEFYLKKYAQANGFEEELAQLSTLSQKPASIPQAFSTGSVGSVSIWEPFVTQVANSKPQEVSVLRQSGLYNLRLYFITRPDVLANKKESIEKFIQSIDNASTYINEHPQEVKEKLEAKFAQEIPQDVWDGVEFGIKTDYENMKELILDDAALAYAIDSSAFSEELELADLNHYFSHNFLTQQ